MTVQILADSKWAPLPALAVLAALTAATGCSRGPAPDALPRDVEHRLETDFEAGLLAIRNLERRGSAPFRDTDRDKSGIYVYFDAELEFLREYSLTSWEGLNLGTLAYALGATEKGVRGFDPRGNDRGDVLTVKGRLAYEQVNGTWQSWRDSLPAETKAEVHPVAQEGSGPNALLRSVRGLVALQPGPTRGSREAVIVEELRRSASRIDLRYARLDGKMTLGTGQAPGTYQEFGQALVAYATENDLPMYGHRSEGSVQNGFDIHSLLLDFALMQSDVAEILFTGWSEEEQVARGNLRSVASLWPEAVHIVTLGDSGIDGIADLRGRTVAIGRPGSGSRFNAIRILAAAGISREELPHFKPLGFAQSVAALEAGEVDALFVTAAVPSRPFQALAQRRPDAKFLSLPRPLLDGLPQQNVSYSEYEVPARTYPGQETPFVTIGVTGMLVTSRLVPDEQVTRLLTLLVDGADALAEKYYRAGFISEETMRLGIAIPLHPAAQRFYEERAARKGERR